MAEFKQGEITKIVVTHGPCVTGHYHTCPKCDGDIWVAHLRDGKGKLKNKAVKFKCMRCGQWFITNPDYLERPLGAVVDEKVSD